VINAAKNLIAGGSLSGFFFIAVETFFQSRIKKSANDFYQKNQQNTVQCTFFIMRIFLHADTGEN
jgi:hypothetical protein